MPRPAVSSLGRFRSSRGVVTTPRVATGRYATVGVHGKALVLHRLIARAFDLPRRPDQCEVNHIDGDISNNRLSNLEWTTRSENILHSYRTNTARASCAVRKSKPVRARRIGTQTWTEFPSAIGAARDLDVHRANLQKCLAGKRRSTCGYEFEYGTPTEPFVLAGEEWREHRGAHVSSLGRVRIGGVTYTPKPRADGYARATVGSNKQLVHRLVALAFLPPPLVGQVEVNHRDGNPSNNVLSNLEWCSKSENIRHSYSTNTARASNVGRSVKPVRGRRVGEEEWILYPGGAKEAARALLIPARAVASACTSGRPTHGRIFEHAEPTVLPGEEWREVD